MADSAPPVMTYVMSPPMKEEIEKLITNHLEKKDGKKSGPKRFEICCGAREALGEGVIFSSGKCVISMTYKNMSVSTIYVHDSLDNFLKLNSKIAHFTVKWID
jgi:hypothetical protein